MNIQGIRGVFLSKKWNSAIRKSRILNSRFRNDPNRLFRNSRNRYTPYFKNGYKNFWEGRYGLMGAFNQCQRLDAAFVARAYSCLSAHEIRNLSGVLLERVALTGLIDSKPMERSKRFMPTALDEHSASTMASLFRLFSTD